MKALAVLVLACACGCLGKGGAVSVRWRIVELETGAFYDPRDISDATGACCQPIDGEPACGGSPGWRIPRVRVVVADPSSGVELADSPMGLDALCSARELTTPFELPSGLFAINLNAFDPAAPQNVDAVSPSPEIRTIRPAEIVDLDVVALSVSVPKPSP